MMTLNDEVYIKIVNLCEKGDNLLNESNYDGAIKNYNMALELIPFPKEIWEASTWVYTAIGDSYYYKCDYEFSIKNFFKAQMCPDGVYNPFINLRIGECYYELGKIENAKEFLLRAYMMEGDDIFKNERPVYYDLLKSITLDSNKPIKCNTNDVDEKVNEISNDIEVQIIDEYGRLWRDERYNECITMLESAWEKLPKVKYSHSASYLIVWFILKTAIKIKNKDVMTEWVDKIFFADPSRGDNGERELWAGKVEYELGNYDKARIYFLSAYNKSDNGRCFTTNDKIYLDFLKSTFD